MKSESLQALHLESTAITCWTHLNETWIIWLTSPILEVPAPGFIKPFTAK